MECAVEVTGSLGGVLGSELCIGDQPGGYPESRPPVPLESAVKSKPPPQKDIT